MKRDLDSLLHYSIDNLVELPDGTKVYGDLKEFYKVVDFFASRYGLGGFKSLEEYAEMINQSDPVIITGLYSAGVDAENAKWSTDDSDNDKPVKSHGTGLGRGLPKDSPEAPRNAYMTTPTQPPGKKGNIHKVKNLLSEFGVSKEELAKAEEKIGRRKIELKDFSHVNKYSLRDMSKDEFSKLLGEFKQQNDRSVNIAVSDEMYRRKIREQRGR